MKQRKATHDGNCQICDSLQRAPGGMMAKHGYTVPHGYFQGICVGSDNIPFQQSKELLEKHIVDIQLQADNLQAYILGFEMHPARIDNGTTLVWKSVEVPKGHRMERWGHEWFEVAIKIVVDAGGDYTRPTSFYRAKYLNPYTQEWQRWDMMYEETEERLLRELVKPWLYAKKQHLDFLTSHLVWQRGRALNWKLLPLPKTVGELDGKDFIVKHTSAGFVRGTEGLGGWNGYEIYYTVDRNEAKRYTERGAAMMMGKVRGKQYHQHKMERFES